MDASIIICTYNRAESLAKTLASIEKLEVPTEIEWEVVVVDNNSSDQTKQIVLSWKDKVSSLRYEFEPEQGLSHARNHGLRSAKGEFILFTDDDVCPEPDWLALTVYNMREHCCEACGGYIAPSWEKAPPEWLTERFYGFLAIKTDESQYQILHNNQLPFGANMAFKRTVFNEVGLFDTTRGRKGSELASGEDGEMFQRILDKKMKVMYFPDSRVHHNIEAFRVQKKYFRRWRFETSKNIAQSRNMPGERRILGVPLYIFVQLLRAIKNAGAAKFSDPIDEAFNKEIILWHFLGTIRGLYSVRRTVS